MADSVEMPADEALADAPDPVADLETQEDEESLEETQQTANEAADAAVETVDDVNAAVDAATRQAEENMD